jgi:DNA-damage-inducible protein J
MKTSVIHARIDPYTKNEAETVLRRLGITPTEAIRIFYSQITLQNGLPFDVKIPNDLTAATLDKSYAGEDVEAFDSLDEMFESLES